MNDRQHALAHAALDRVLEHIPDDAEDLHIEVAYRVPIHMSDIPLTIVTDPAMPPDKIGVVKHGPDVPIRPSERAMMLADIDAADEDD